MPTSNGNKNTINLPNNYRNIKHKRKGKFMINIAAKKPTHN